MSPGLNMAGLGKCAGRLVNAKSYFETTQLNSQNAYSYKEM